VLLYNLLITALWQRENKGNGALAPTPAAMIAEQAQHWLTNFHEILTKKRGKAGAGDQGALLSTLSRVPYSCHGGQRRVEVSKP
jgi:hypothetical protein